MNDDKIDRRFHWAQYAITGIIAATIWCVKLEMNLSTLKDDFTQYKRDIKQTAKELDNRLDGISDRVLVVETLAGCRDDK